MKSWQHQRHKPETSQLVKQHLVWSNSPLEKVGSGCLEAVAQGLICVCAKQTELDKIQRDLTGPKPCGPNGAVQIGRSLHSRYPYSTDNLSSRVPDTEARKTLSFFDLAHQVNQLPISHFGYDWKEFRMHLQS